MSCFQCHGPLKTFLCFYVTYCFSFLKTMYLSASYTIKLAPYQDRSACNTGLRFHFHVRTTKWLCHISTLTVVLYNTQKLMGNLSNLMATVMSNRHLVGTANCQNLLNVSGCFFWWKKIFWHKGHTLFLLFFITIDFIVYLHLMTIKIHINDFFLF